MSLNQILFTSHQLVQSCSDLEFQIREKLKNMQNLSNILNKIEYHKRHVKRMKKNKIKAPMSSYFWNIPTSKNNKG